VSQTSGLTVRQHARTGIEVPFEFIIADEHRAQVHFSPSSSALDSYTIRGKAVDISSGGMGLECRQFIPRMCEGTVRLFSPKAESSLPASAGSQAADCLFEHRAKVRRVYTIGREPTYALGVAFVNPEPVVDQQINKLLECLPATRPDSEGAARRSAGDARGTGGAGGRHA
jgi:hypothetical protein